MTSLDRLICWVLAIGVLIFVGSLLHSGWTAANRSLNAPVAAADH